MAQDRRRANLPAHPLPLVDARGFFDAVARRYDRVYGLSGAATRGRMARVLASTAGKPRVLVLGIGTGRELPALLDHGHVVTGLDVSAPMTAELARRSRTVEVVLSDFFAEPLPFDDASFDAVLALHGTLAHPPHEDALGALAEEIARVLAAGGVLVAEVPAAEHLAAIEADHPDAGLRVAVTGARTFVHEDAVAGVAIEGVALTAEEWRRVLAPRLDASVEPLGAAEHLVVARRREPK